MSEKQRFFKNLKSCAVDAFQSLPSVTDLFFLTLLAIPLLVLLGQASILSIALAKILYAYTPETAWTSFFITIDLTIVLLFLEMMVLCAVWKTFLKERIQRKRPYPSNENALPFVF